MLRADPPDHTRLRALVQSAFTPLLISSMREHVQQIADRLVDAVQATGHMDLIAEFAFPLPVTVISEMLGVPAADAWRFRRWSAALIRSGAVGGESPPIIPEMFLLIAYMRRLIRTRRRRAQPGDDDLIARLIQASDQGHQLSQREVVSTSILLLIAGHETTVNLIGSGMLALLEDRPQFERLQQDPQLIKPAIEELLRLVNPAQVVNRYASQDMQIGGVHVPRGSHLMLVIAAANHDPAYVADPDRVDVTRVVRQHVAFGQGIHYCLGAPLARLEGEIAFSTLLTRLPRMRLATAPEKLEWRPGMGLRGLTALPVTF